MKVNVKRWRKPSEQLTEKGKLQRAWYIHNNYDAPQDFSILCPITVEGVRCQWVAGHIGGHNI